MNIVIMVAAIVLHLILHEGAHGFAMKHRGVRLAEAAIGIGPAIYSWHSRRLDCPAHLRLLPVMGYVEPAEHEAEKLEKRSYRDQTACYGAGIIVNLILAFAAYAAMGLWAALSGNVSLGLWRIAIGGGLALVFWFGRGWIMAYVLPVIGVLTLALIVFSFIVIGGQAIGGPISTATTSPVTGQHAIAAVADISIGYQFLAALVIVGLGLATFNALPLFILDGGRIADAILRRFCSNQKTVKYWRITTGCLAVGLFIFAIGGDILRLIF
jgi:membrane-associated protease RseP (regulator of RpoE activity)